MITKFLRKKSRIFWRRLRSRAAPVVAWGVLLVFGIVGYAIHMSNQPPTVDPAAYKPLLNLIGRIESNDNYNAYFSNSKNTEIRFTEMTVAEVLAWQANFVAQGNASSAVGRYQIINTTLSGLVSRKIVSADELFSEATQDLLAIALLERRGSLEYVTKQLAPEQFAANLAKEWAALPRVLGGDPNASYYQSDGLNKSRTTVAEVMKAIEPISAH